MARARSFSIDGATGKAKIDVITDPLPAETIQGVIEGVSFGLSIVSKIINDHSGSIYFKNQKNGATVEIN